MSETFKIMLENQKLYNQLWRRSWMIDGINGRNFGRGLSKEYLDQILFFLTVFLLKKIFKDLQFYNQSEAIVAILDIGQDHQT